jgi:exportin-T
MEIPREIVTAILSGIGDLLVLNVELPDEDSPQDDILEVAVNTPTLFDSQIYLFETVGTLLSLLGNTPDQQLSLLQVVRLSHAASCITDPSFLRPSQGRF